MAMGGQGDPEGVRGPYGVWGGMGDPKAFLWGHGADMETLKEHGDPMGSGGGDGGPQGL